MVSAIFPHDADSGQLRHDVSTFLHDSDINISLEYLEEQDWSATWRKDFHAMRFGSRLWVCPTHESPPDPDAIVVDMDPGLAFGTGTHTTTAMCLEWLDSAELKDRQLVDYGCGSGVLAIAALALGAASAVAVDIDPQAREACADNAARNGVSGRLEVLSPDDLAPGRRFDAVVANILSGTLIELAPTFKMHCRAGTAIALSGILAEQGAAVTAAFAEWVAFDPPMERGGWVLLSGTVT